MEGRPVAGDAGTNNTPCDAVIAGLGTAERDRILQAEGKCDSLTGLLVWRAYDEARDQLATRYLRRSGSYRKIDTALDAAIGQKHDPTSGN